MDIRNHSDQRGSLFVYDTKDVPFEVKRSFWVSGFGRGHHAHKECIQLYICIRGYAFVTRWKGATKEVVMLNEGDAILINPMEWSSEEVIGTLLVLCSHEYNEKDYIRDFNQYLKEYGN